jgi:hypothetical protein
MHDPQLQNETSCRRPGASLPVRLALSLVVTFVCIRSAVSVVTLTYASIGRTGLILVVSCSLIYFVIVTVIAKWDRIAGNVPACYLYCIKEIPSFLALGIIAVVIEVFFGYNEIEPRAYPLRMLIIVFALFNPFSYGRFLPQSSRLRKIGKVAENKRSGESSSEVIGARSMSEWLSTNALARSILVASYVLDSSIWTWLVIYYRYYSHSFLDQSVWVMSSLWIFLASSWVHCIGASVFVRSCKRLTNTEVREVSETIKFRTDSPLLPWLLVGFVCIYSFGILQGNSFYPPWHVNFVSVLILSVMLYIFSAIFTYWELDMACLRQRRIWKVKEIAWQDVTRVSRLGFSSKNVMISYGRVPEDCAYILANPCNCDRFIEALHRFAPHAEFDT